jgi:hypothetical protein
MSFDFLGEFLGIPMKNIGDGIADLLFSVVGPIGK